MLWKAFCLCNPRNVNASDGEDLSFYDRPSFWQKLFLESPLASVYAKRERRRERGNAAVEGTCMRENGGRGEGSTRKKAPPLPLQYMYSSRRRLYSSIGIVAYRRCQEEETAWGES